MRIVSIQCYIPIFVFGTLRANGRFSKYLTEFLDTKQDVFIKNYQLCELESGDVYIEKPKSTLTCSGVHGEIYHINYECLWRIQHLENSSGSFPKTYELAILDGARGKDGKEILGFYFSLKRKKVISSGDCFQRDDLMSKLKHYIEQTPADEITDDNIICAMHRTY